MKPENLTDAVIDVCFPDNESAFLVFGDINAFNALVSLSFSSSELLLSLWYKDAQTAVKLQIGSNKAEAILACLDSIFVHLEASGGNSNLKEVPLNLTE